MMALIFDPKIVNSLIQMLNKNNVLLYVFRMVKDCFAKSNVASVNYVSSVVVSINLHNTM